MTQVPLPDESLRGDLEILAGRDGDLARAYAACGLPPVRHSPPGFAGLIRIIVGQQVSTASAAAILARLAETLPDFAAEAFLALDDKTLAAVGFSRAKIGYGRALAEAVAAGHLDPAEIERLADEEAIARLTAIKGIGRWTAEIYLLFALRRPDVWPAGDLAVVKALCSLKGLGARPGAVDMSRLAEPWRPHRSAAARLLWHYYRHAGVAL
jgi:DNA-3-methyladenine glycosylase II